MEHERRVSVSPAWARVLGAVVGIAAFGALFSATDGVFFFVGGLLVLVRLARLERKELRRLRLSPGKLAIDGKHVSIQSGWFEAGLSPHVVLRGPTGIVRIDVNDDTDADRVFDSLGLDVDHRGLGFSVGMPGWAEGASSMAVGLLGLAAGACICVALATSGTLRSIVGWATLLPLLGTVFIKRGKLLVGRSGILVRAPFARRFFPIESIRDVRATRLAVEILTADGWIEIGLIKDEAARAGIVQRIRDAIAPRVADVQVAALLERRDQPVREWIERVRTLGGHAYRETSVRAEELRQILEHHGSSWARLGAAIVLAKDPEERAHVRIAARSVRGTEAPRRARRARAR